MGDGVNDCFEDRSHIVLRTVRATECLAGGYPLVLRHEPTGLLDLNIERSGDVTGVKLIVHHVHRICDSSAPVRHRLNVRMAQPPLRVGRAEQDPGGRRAKFSALRARDQPQFVSERLRVVARSLGPEPGDQIRAHFLEGCRVYRPLVKADEAGPTALFK